MGPDTDTGITDGDLRRRIYEHLATTGAAPPFDTMWSLSQGWCADRLDPDFSPRPAEATQQLFTDAGLTDPFWQLRA